MSSSLIASSSLSKPPFVGEKVKLSSLLEDSFSGEWGKETGVNPVPVLRTANFNEDGTFDYTTPAMRCISANKVSRKAMRRGDIVLEKSGGTPNRPVGIMAYYDSDALALCSNFNHVLRFNMESSNSRYMFYQLRWLKEQNAFEPYTRKTTGLQNLQMKSFIDLSLKCPDLDIQNERANTLQSIHEFIQLQIAHQDKLDQLIKSRFVEMFGDPCDLGNRIYPVRTLKDFCELRIGPFGSALHKEDYISGGHPIVNPSHIVADQIEPDPKLSIGEAKYASMEPYHLHVGDVVLGRRGEIGRCAVVTKDGLVCGTGSMILRPNPTLCRSDYLQRVVSFPSFASALERDAVGVTMKNLNAKIVGNAMVVLPRLELQKKFADFVAQVDKSRFICMHISRRTICNNSRTVQ